MFSSIWERYFLRQFCALFFLFLFCFYGLYVLIDYASRTSALSSHHVQIPLYETVRYYLFVFASRAEILLPLALLIAFVKTVCTLNSNQELVALMAGGVNLKLLMRPFIIFGFICMALMYANEQFLLPGALKKLRYLENATKHQRHRHSAELSVNHLLLEDSSLFLFQRYDKATNTFYDSYWISSINDIYRIKFLAPKTDVPTGKFVDHFSRLPDGELSYQASYEEFQFPALKFKREILQSSIADPDVLSLSNLFAEASSISINLNEKESRILTAFYWKTAMPWLCILAILAPAPFCVKFSRKKHIFLIYICTLFGLIMFYMLMDAAQVVAKRQVMPPFWAICAPFLVAFALFGWRFVKIR